MTTKFWTFADQYSALNYGILADLKFSGEPPAKSGVWSGTLHLVDNLSTIAQLLDVGTTQQLSISGKIDNVDEKIPIITLQTAPVKIQIGSFSLSTTLQVTCKTYPTYKVPVTALGLNSTIKMGGKSVDIVTNFGTMNDIITFRLQDPLKLPLSISELNTLLDNSSIQQVIPSQLPLPSTLTLEQWSLSVNTGTSPSISTMAMGVSLDGTWPIIPKILIFEEIQFFFALSAQPPRSLSGTVTATFAIEDTFKVTLGASYPDFVFYGYLTEDSTPASLTSVTSKFGFDSKHLDDLQNTSSLKVGSLEMQLAPKQRSFGANLYLDFGTDGWTFFTVGSIDFALTQAALTLQHSAGQTVGSIAGTIKIGTEPVGLFAEYSTTDGWTFQGSLEKPADLSTILADHFPDLATSIKPLFSDLTIDQLDVTVKIGKNGYRYYAFEFEFDWQTTFFEHHYPLDAKVTLTSERESTNGQVDQTGCISGTVKDFVGMDVTLELELHKSTGTPTYEDLIFILDGELKGTFEKRLDEYSVDISLASVTLGDMVSRLVSAATTFVDETTGTPLTRGQSLQLPAPWDVLNNISLDNFDLKFIWPAKGMSKPRTVALDYEINLSLTPAIHIGAIGLTYSIPAPINSPKVHVRPTGRFLTTSFADYFEKPGNPKWDATNPDTAPTPPGKGNALFDMHFLGVGQRVVVKGSPSSMSKAIQAMEGNFKKPQPKTTPLPKGGGVTYNAQAGWLIGMDATLLKGLFDLSIIFNDPKLYGLLIQVHKGKIQGLRFEIMYKKLNNHLGVYYLALTLPDFLRHLEFGEASLTLPVVKLWIYTNGGFKIDIGFPYHGDFSQSASLQVLPFVGSGGFYFGVLHNQSVPHLPVPKSGTFNPIIVFGVGARVGLGKDFSAGPFSGGIDVTVQGILQGIIAVYNPPNVANKDTHNALGKPYYYYIQAKVAIVGKIYAKLDLAIVSASIKVTIKLQATLALAAYKAAHIQASAELSVYVSVTLHVPFKVHFHHTFTARAHVRFTIGHDRSDAPWDQFPKSTKRRTRQIPTASLALGDGLSAGGASSWNPAWQIDKRMLELTDTRLSSWRPMWQADSGKKILSIADGGAWQPTSDNWQANPLAGIDLETLSLYFVMKFTLAQIGNDRIPQGVALLMIDAPGSKPDKSIMEFSSSKLAKQLLLWVFNTYFVSQKKKGTIQTLALTEIEIEAILTYFHKKAGGMPVPRLTWTEIENFFTYYTTLKFTVIPESPTGFPTSFNAFPMLQNLQLTLPGQGTPIDFSKTMVDEAYLIKLRNAFNQPSSEESATPKGITIPTEPLTTYLLSDYLQLIIKQGLQQVQNQFKATILDSADLKKLAAPKAEAVSLDEVVQHHPEFGLTQQELALANANVPLMIGKALRLTGAIYTLGMEYGITAAAEPFFKVPVKAIANVGINPHLAYKPLTKDTEVTYSGPSGATTYKVKIQDTLQSIARHFGVPGITGPSGLGYTGIEALNNRLLWPNLNGATVAKQLFQPGTNLHIPPFYHGITALQNKNGKIETLADIADRYGLNVSQIVAPTGPTAKQAYTNGQVAIFPTNENLTIPKPAKLDTGFILEKLSGPTADTPSSENFYQHAGSMASHFLMHGLRLPKPGASDGDRQGIYQLTGQQFGTEHLTAGSTATLSTSGTPPAWLKFPKGSQIDYGIGSTAMDEINAFKAVSNYTGPTATIQGATSYHLQPQHFALSEHIPWRIPERPLGATGIVPPISWTDTTKSKPSGIVGNYSIWKFPQKLESVLASAHNGKGPSGVMPPEDLGFVLEKTPHPVNPDKPIYSQNIKPHRWTTMIRVALEQPSKATGATRSTLVNREKDPYIYEVRGTNQSDKHILEMLLAHADNIEGIFLLYPEDGAQKGQSSTIAGLKSLHEPTAFMINTNLTGNTGVTAPGEPIGATANNFFMQELWKNDEVHQSGYYLYYEAEKKPLPKYLFAKNASTEITLLVTHTIPAKQDDIYKLPPYINSMILEETINPQEAVLSVVPTGTFKTFDSRFQVKLPTTHPGYIDVEMTRPYPVVTSAQDGKGLLQESYNILEYQVPGQTGWHPSKPGLPVGPHHPQGITEPPTHLHYHDAVPVAALATSHQTSIPEGLTGPSLNDTPYAGVGQEISLDFRFLDIFGNKLDAMPEKALPKGTTGAWPRSKTFVGYTDHLIGLDSWPHLLKSYTITGTSGKATLNLDFAFITSHYYDVYQTTLDKSNAKTPADKAEEARLKALAVAQADFETVTTLYYQLAQKDVDLSVVSSLEPKETYTTATIKADLQTFVSEIWGFIGAKVDALNKDTYKQPVEKPSNKTTSITLPITLSQITEQDIFLMMVKLSIKRTNETLIDPAFSDVPAVKETTAVIPPTLQQVPGEGATATPIHNLTKFAQQLEGALETSDYQLKVAAHLPDRHAPQSKAESAHSVSLVRLAKHSGATGLYFEIDNDPIYYAPKPVATTVLNRSGVPIYNYESGKPLNSTTHYQLKTFAGFNMEAMARKFLSAMDDVLSPTMAMAIAMIDQDKFKQLLTFKTVLANTLSKQIAPIFEHNKANQASKVQAQERFREELLVGLSRYYKVETIVQCAIDSLNASNQEKHVRFFGKLRALDKKAVAPYAFSTSEVDLVQGATGAFFTSLFEISHAPTSKDTDDSVENQVDLPLQANYQVTGLEHNFRPAPVADYKDTDWLSFVLPYSVQATNKQSPSSPLSLDIPLPLRAYPTPPTLKHQTDLAISTQFGKPYAPKKNPLTLNKALTWDYAYTYRYHAAAQDIVSTSVSFNVGPTANQGPGPSAGKPYNSWDLATALLQFTQVYPKILADLQKYVTPYATSGKDELASPAALAAVESFCYVADRVVYFWPLWYEYERQYAYQYEIEQMAGKTGPHSPKTKPLAIKVDFGPTSINPHPDIPLPTVNIPDSGFTTIPQPNGPASIIYNYRSATGTYLSWDDRDNYPDRQVKFNELNIFKQENAWAGVGVVRNEDLGEKDGKRVKTVNNDFVYQTPLVRFVNILNPLLDPAGALDLSDVLKDKTPAPDTLNGANGYLADFFAELFADYPPHLEEGYVHLKIGGSYRYRLNGPTGSGNSTEGVTTTLPIFITVPYWYNLQNGRKDLAFVDRIFNNIDGWLKSKPQLKPHFGEPDPLEGTLVFDLTVFSSITQNQLPILHLREITVAVNKLKDLL